MRQKRSVRSKLPSNGGSVSKQDVEPCGGACGGGLTDVPATPAAAAPMQRSEESREDEELAQRKPQASGGVPTPILESAQSVLGQDLSGVRFHTNSSKAPEMGARAYTQGRDVHFAPGEFDPASSKGKELAGHELTHVVQQAEGRVRPTGDIAGTPLNDDPSLEAEADAQGAKIGRAADQV